MAEIFLYLLNMSITASWLILAVLLLRILLKKAPKWISCFLWCLVGIRLLVPVSVDSMFSLIPSANVVSQEILYEISPTIDSGIDSVNQVVNPILQENFSPDVAVSVNPLQIVAYVAANIWILGMVVLLIYTLITYVRLRKRVSDAVRLNDNIYQSERVGSPFVLGIVKPRIYVPYGLNEEELNCVIAHEQAHIKRRDHLLKPIAFLVLTVYWFNPLVWVAYILLCRDIEFACDEKVLRQLGKGKKKVYSEALLRVSISGNVSHKMIAACPIAFGEVGVKSRIKGVLNYKKPAFWIVIVALLACAVCIVCFMTNPEEDGSGEELSAAEVSASVFESYNIDVSEIKWDDITQIAIYSDGYYDRSLEQPLMLTEQAQIDKMINLANPSTQKYEQIEGGLEGLCGVFVDFGNGIVFSMYADANYGLIGDGMCTTGEPYVRFPQELYDEVIALLESTSMELEELQNEMSEREQERKEELENLIALQNEMSELEQEALDARTQRFKSPPTMLLRDALSSTMEYFAVVSGTYSWNYPDKDDPDMMTSAEAGGAHPASAVKGQEWLQLKEYNGLDYAAYVVSFDVMPDHITVRDYDLLELADEEATVISETSYETASEELLALELRPRRIYEVVAEWDQENLDVNGFYGTANYAFATDNYLVEVAESADEEVEQVTLLAHVKEILASGQEIANRPNKILISSDTDTYPGAFIVQVPQEVYDIEDLAGGDSIVLTMWNTMEVDSNGKIPIYQATHLEKEKDVSDAENMENGGVGNDLTLGEKFTEEVNTLSGVSMYMEKYKSTEGDVEFSNDTDQEYQYGEYYDIQVQKDGEWYSLQTKTEVAYKSIAILLPAGSGTVWEVNWEYAYGALPEGKYRIVKDIMDYRAPGDYTKYYLAAEFEITPAY